jgi:hypothetical protein
MIFCLTPVCAAAEAAVAVAVYRRFGRKGITLLVLLVALTITFFLTHH